MSLFGTDATVDSLLETIEDDTADLLDFITADIKAAREELHELEEIKEKLESIAKDENALYKEDLTDTELNKLEKRLKVVGDRLKDAHEQQYEQQDNNPEENRELDQVLGEVRKLRKLYKA